LTATEESWVLERVEESWVLEKVKEKGMERYKRKWMPSYKPRRSTRLLSYSLN
jgi:hypothetical protein